VGTHALLADRVDFSDLGLVIIDEQHRFGVAQRVRLRVGPEARATLPHLLVMTATPIPRSLALTIYGDLDVTTLDELPPGRTPAATRVLSGERGRRAAYRQLAAVVDEGGRAFVVCPLVAPSEESDWASRPPKGSRASSPRVASVWCTAACLPSSATRPWPACARASSTCWWPPR
jgi:ATP-dependent DNA helicase RecG